MVLGLSALIVGMLFISSGLSQGVPACVYEKGSPDPKITACTKAIAAGGNGLSTSFNERGVAYYNNKDFDRAMADLNEAIRLDPYLAIAFNNRGKVLLAAHNVDRALVDVNEAIRLDPHNVSFLVNRAEMYRTIDDQDRSIADLDQAIALDPKLVSAYRMRGNAYRAKKAFDRGNV
jgi:tetratricopeptide (TPR) repeat protein